MMARDTVNSGCIGRPPREAQLNVLRVAHELPLLCSSSNQPTQTSLLIGCCRAVPQARYHLSLRLADVVLVGCVWTSPRYEVGVCLHLRFSQRFHGFGLYNIGLSSGCQGTPVAFENYLCMCSGVSANDRSSYERDILRGTWMAGSHMNVNVNLHAVTRPVDILVVRESRFLKAQQLNGRAFRPPKLRTHLTLSEFQLKRVKK